ncbi:mucin-3A [Sabethes cyaneus]|uniref:mucin-3A n=1 Tax=Sabethes cyaneus TaxID=53552 RepID=UPI00237E9059|nr:mucin-3A [Sabethes cyaneus]
MREKDSVPHSRSTSCCESITHRNQLLPVPSSESALPHLTFYYQNTHGLRSKISDFALEVCDSPYDCIVLTESWLDSQINSAELFGTEYTVYRCDRTSKNSTKARGGGVVIAVRRSLSSALLVEAMDESLEQLWVTMNINDSKVVIGAIYIPPNLRNEVDILDRHILSLERAVNSMDINDDLLLFGDYNRPGLSWSAHPQAGYLFVDALRSSMNAGSACLLDGMALHSMYQINNVCNQNGRFLDLIFANQQALSACSVTTALVSLSNIDIHHPPLIVTFNRPIKAHFIEEFDSNSFDFRRGNYDAINSALREFDWATIHACSDRITTPARILAARTGATQFQEYTDKEVNDEQQQKRFQKRLILDSANVDFENYQGVVGRPGIDFPILTGIPNTNFNCRQYGNGYFADLDTKCQAFHICDEGKKISFLCPNGTIFRQLDLICDWWFKVDCAAAPNHYAESSEMLTQAQRARIQSKHPIPQPIKSPEQFSLNVQRKHALLNNPFGPNYDAITFNRRMDTSIEQSDESIDFVDISLKRNNVRRTNKNSKSERSSSEESQTAAETASFFRTGKNLDGYSYPSPMKIIEGAGSHGYSYDKPIKFIDKNDKREEQSRSAKVLNNNGDTFGSKNSFNFNAKPFITKTTDSPPTSTTTRQQTIKATTATSGNRGSTTHQTSTLNQKAAERKPQMSFEPRSSKIPQTPPQDNLNFPAYTTARKPNTKAKDKPFYTPTIPTILNRALPESTTPVIPTAASQSGAVEHAIEMMKTLQKLEMSEAALESRPGVEVPPSSGPNALHSLALYFANDSENNTAATVTTPVTTHHQTERVETDNNRNPVSAKLFSQKTIDKYQQLFDVKDPSTTTESLEFETRIEDDNNNDLEGQFSRHPIFGASGSPQIRELAQVFTHALSAYLQDPESFRRILSEIRPKEPVYSGFSNQIDNRINQNEDIFTDEAGYYSSQQQATPSPRTAVTDDLEVLDFSDFVPSTTAKTEAHTTSAETTTETPFTTTSTLGIQPAMTSKLGDSKKRPSVSNLISDSLEKNALNYKERQPKALESTLKTDNKNELADEVNEELGTLKPPAFKVVESIEDTDEKTGSSSYFPLHEQFKKHSTPDPYGKDVKPANSTPITDTYPTALSDTQAVPLRWGQDIAVVTTTTDSTPTVYFDLLPPHNQKLRQPSSIFQPPDHDLLEDDEQLQRAQSQSIVANRNQIDTSKQAKTIYSFLNLEKELQTSGKNITASFNATMTSTPNALKGHYITRKFPSDNQVEVTTLFPNYATSSIPDVGKITPNSKTTLSYTVFLDPLTINDGLMHSQEEEKTTILNAHTYLPRNQKTSTRSIVASTTPSSGSITNNFSTRHGKSNIQSKVGNEESNELIETMQRKANQMFGDLNDSEADHLMNVMKTAETNKSVRRLILLLIQTCDDDYNKTVEESRRALLNALINMDSTENDSSEIRIVTSASHKRRDLNKTSTRTTTTLPLTTYQNLQFEKFIGTTAGRESKQLENLETTTLAYEDTKSTNLDLSFEASTKFIEQRFNSDESDSVTSTSFFPDQYTTTSLPTTTIDYETTTAALTTTDIPTTTVISTVVTNRPPVEHTTPVLQRAFRTRVTTSNRVQKSLGTAEEFVAESNNSYSNHHSDTRALELLRSLYSLASRWG